MKKRILGLVLVLCIILGMAVVPAHAATGGKCGDNLTWTLYDGCRLEISGTGDMYNYSTNKPPWYNETITTVKISYGVTSIGASAFCLNYRLPLKSVTIPASVTRIEKSAFLGCSNLNAVTIPDSVTSIGESAFYDCSNFYHITIGKGVTSIGESAFKGCKNIGSVYISDLAAWCNIKFENVTANPLYYANKLYLNDKLITDLVIPDSVTSIGYEAFGYCSSLTGITIPDSVTSIDSYAFYNCSGLTSVKIGNGVTSIESSAFSGCNRLTSINVSENNQNYSSQDGILFNKAKTELIRCPKGKQGSYIIPDSVTSIGDWAFYDCSNLTSITIPDSVTSIGMSALNRCSGLTSITIPSSVTSIGTYAFYNCSGLTSITLPDSVTSIGTRVFEGCSGITSAILGCTFYDMFNGCENLNSITIEEGVKNIAGDAFRDLKSLNKISIPSSVTSIEGGAFEGCKNIGSVYISDLAAWCNISFYNRIANPLHYAHKLYLNDKLITNLVIPDSVTSIGALAFYDCSSLKSITIGNSVTSIGNCAFEYCSSLAGITIPDSVTSIGSGAFEYCSGLTSVKIGKGVTSIGSGAFYNCSSISEVHISDVAAWCNINFSGSSNNPLYYAHKLYLNDELVTNLVIPDSVTSIRWYAFSGCSGLTSVTIPNSVTSVGNYAFSGCSSLTSITITDSVTSIGDSAFSNCSSIKKVYYSGNSSQWNNISIGLYNDYLKKAERYCFYDITYTGEYEGTDMAYYLTSVTFPTLPELPYGYLKYSFKVNGTEWDGVVKGDTTVVVTKTPINYTVTYTGDYEATDNADYLTTVTFPTAPYGYTYTFKVNDEIWDGVVKGDTTVVVTKTPINYTVTFTGDYIETQSVAYNTKANLPNEYGYTYTFKVNGSDWDGIVKDDTTVVVTKTPINYTVTYTGEYEGTDYADYLTTAKFPTAPYGYTYTFKVNDEIWDGIVRGKTTVAVTKTINNYTVTYTGDYEGTDNADYLTTVTLPTPPENYIYRFTVNGSAWDGVVKGDTTVLVSKLCDLTELDITNLEEIQKDEDSIYGKFYGKYFTPQVTVSENAAYSIYRDENCTQTLSRVTLSRGENTFYIKVTAESGRIKVYKITVDRDIPESLGTLSVLNVEGDAITFKADTEIVGNPTVKILYGENENSLTNQRMAEIGEDGQSLSISGLPTDKIYYFKAVATYDDIQIESPVIFTTLAKCYVLQVLSPSGSTIDHENGTITGLRVASDVEKVVIDVEVSPKATWDLYYTATSNATYANKELTLREGQAKTAYIRVKAEDGTEKTYLVSVYRQTKSEKPSIFASLGLARITSVDGKNIIYTIDGTEPSESNGIRYSGPFEVSEGMVIKAIAKQDEMDEYSDATVYEVKDANVYLTPIDVYYDGEKINYELFAESNKPIYGIFMLAVYDAKGKMTTLFEADAISGETEKLIDGSLSVANKDYSTCKVMLWNNYNEMKPLTKAVLIEK